MDFAETVTGNVGVDFRRADSGVAEQFLDNAEIGAMLQKMGGETVAEHVGSNVASEAGTTDALFDAEPKCNGGKRGAAFGQENVAGGFLRDQFGTASIDKALDCGDGLSAERNDAFLVAFADHVDETGFEVQLFEADVA